MASLLPKVHRQPRLTSGKLMGSFTCIALHQLLTIEVEQYNLFSYGYSSSQLGRTGYNHVPEKAGDH